MTGTAGPASPEPAAAYAAQARTAIEREHRSLAAVLHGMLHLIREVRYAGAPLDKALLEAMLGYIDAFSERYHHPKEEAYLFERVGVRCDAALPLIAKLQAEHAEGAAMLEALHGTLARCAGRGSEFDAFAAGAARYAAFHWTHMRAEEDELIPLATASLKGDDWRTVAEAFADHRDPLSGVDTGARFEALFKRIVEMAPSPIGRAQAERGKGRGVCR